MTSIKEGSIVEFNPLFHTDEIYIYEMPEIGSIGKVTRMAIDQSFMMVWGIVLPLCEVDFSGSMKMIYSEDLKLISDGT